MPLCPPKLSILRGTSHCQPFTNPHISPCTIQAIMQVVNSFAMHFDYLDQQISSIEAEGQVTIKFRIRPTNQVWWLIKLRLERRESSSGSATPHFQSTASVPSTALIKKSSNCSLIRTALRMMKFNEFWLNSRTIWWKRHINTSKWKENKWMLCTVLRKLSYDWKNIQLLYRKNYQALLGLARTAMVTGKLRKAFEYVELFCFFLEKEKGEVCLLGKKMKAQIIK